LTYDIKPQGYTQGTPARVVIPVDGSFDRTKPVIIIDHASGTVYNSPIVDNEVAFGTDHFKTGAGNFNLFVD
jgi:hypothetical protein